MVGSATYHRLVEPLVDTATPADIDLYIAELRRSAELAKEKYGARLVVLYLPDDGDYLKNSGITDTMIKERLRRSGLELIDASLAPQDFPGIALKIPGDGHPTGAANRARAALLKAYLETSAAK